MLLGGAEAGPHSTTVPRGHCRGLSSLWSCPGKMGHGALSCQLIRGRAEAAAITWPAARLPGEEQAPVSITTSCSEICRASTHVLHPVPPPTSCQLAEGLPQESLAQPQPAAPHAV